MADVEQDGRIAQLLEERRRTDSTLRGVDTLRQIHPDLAEEVLRLATTEDALAAAAQDWNDVGGDETVSSAAVGNIADTQGVPNAGAGELPKQISRYRVTGILGEGGMGTVYAAEDPQLQRRVAIKVPHFSGSADKQEQARKRFLREARSVAAVEHPNVCPIHDVGEHEGRPFVVMAMIEGESLTTRLLRKPLPSAQDSRALVGKIAQGLAAVHALGIVHRDLKPGNILLRKKDGAPILTDFGLAQIDSDGDQLTADGVIVGTPAYMAPEQADPTLGPVTSRSDLYSLGVILFELVTGRRPFDGTLAQIIGRLASGVAPSASQFRADLDPALNAIIARAMARQPNDRFADAAAFAEALSGWLQGTSSPTVTLLREPAVNTVTMPPLKRRMPRWQIGAAALAFVGFGSLAAYLMRDDRRPLPPEPAAPGPGVANTDKKPVVPATPQRGVIDVKVWPKGRSQKAGVGLNDPAALPLAPGDFLRVEVELSRPAYCYVVWIDTEGQVTPLYPWLEADWTRRPLTEEPKSFLSFPEEADKVVPLGEGPAGMETLVLLTRDEILPADVNLKEVLGKFPAQKAPDPRAAAWFENGKLVTKELHRGPIRLDQARPVDNPILQTQAQLRARLGEMFGYTRAVSFANKGD